MSITAKATKQSDPPRVWLVSGYRAGERNQILALGEALGWPFEIKDIYHRRIAIHSKLFRGSDLGGIDVNRSSPLTAPWPDIIISAGMGNEPVCRWIRKQSGGKALIVHIGKPWADARHFDLVITSPQYRLPQRPNVLHNELTMHRVTSERLSSSTAKGEAEIARLPRPYIAVMVGGNSGPYTFGPHAAKRLAVQASNLARTRGASLLLTTSARTSAVACQTLRENIDVPVVIHPWRDDDPDNPYLSYLGLADEIIVTMDSISMLSEACATGKPVHMFNFDGNPASDTQIDFRAGALLYRGLMRWGPTKWSRDLSIVHRNLISSGLVCWLGESKPGVRPPPPRDVDRSVARVRQLVADHRQLS